MDTTHESNGSIEIIDLMVAKRKELMEQIERIDRCISVFRDGGDGDTGDTGDAPVKRSVTRSATRTSSGPQRGEEDRATLIRILHESERPLKYSQIHSIAKGLLHGKDSLLNISARVTAMKNDGLLVRYGKGGQTDPFRYAPSERGIAYMRNVEKRIARERENSNGGDA